MKQEIPWNRFAIEAIVIVGSILLAFAIDSTWQNFRESIQEEEMLQFVLGEVRSNKTTITELLTRSENDQSNVERFFGHPENTSYLVSWEEAAALFNGMYRPNTFDLSETSLSGIVISGRIDSVNSEEIRQALESLGNLNRLLNNRTAAMRGITSEVLLRLGEHNEYRTWNLQFGEENDPPLELTEIRSDERVLAAANAVYQQRRVNSRILVTLAETLDVLESLLFSYLNEF